MRRPVAKGARGTPLGEFTTLPQTSYSEADGRGEQGAMPSQTMGKKIKLSCRNMHIDALAVAVINDHKQLINIAAFHHLRHIDTKKCSPPDP